MDVLHLFPQDEKGGYSVCQDGRQCVLKNRRCCAHGLAIRLVLSWRRWKRICSLVVCSFEINFEGENSEKVRDSIPTSILCTSTRTGWRDRHWSHHLFSLPSSIALHPIFASAGRLRVSTTRQLHGQFVPLISTIGRTRRSNDVSVACCVTVSWLTVEPKFVFR